LIAEQSKLETIKMMGARSKINAISLNVKINERKSVHLRGYILPINVQNFMQKDWAEAKISMKLVGGLLFWLTLYTWYIAHKRTLASLPIDQN